MHIREIKYDGSKINYRTRMKNPNTIHFLNKKVINFIKDLQINSNDFSSIPEVGVDKSSIYDFSIKFLLDEEEVKDSTVYCFAIYTNLKLIRVLIEEKVLDSMLPLINLYDTFDFLNIKKLIGQLLKLPSPIPGCKYPPLPRLNEDQKLDILGSIYKTFVSWSNSNEKRIFFIKHSELLLNLMDKIEMKKQLEELFPYTKKQVFLDCIQLAQDGLFKINKNNK